MEGFFFIVMAFIGVAILFRLLAGGMDRDRIRRYVESRGGRLLKSHWAPFGRGWFGEKNDRIYEVRFIDRDGNEHRATCKTSMWSGVYWTEDAIVRYAAAPEQDDAAESLEEENRRLREEVERLRRQQGQFRSQKDERYYRG